MKNKLRIFIAIAFFGVTGFMNAAAEDVARDMYMVMIGTDNNDFADDSVAKAGGDGIDGEVFLYINGNPISPYSKGGLMTPINQWLNKGSNTISFSGKSEKSLFLKVTLTRGNEFVKVVSKKEFKAQDIAKGNELEFNLKLKYKLPIFRKSSSIPETFSTKDIYPILEKIKRLTEQKKYTEFVNYLLAQRQRWNTIGGYIKKSDFSQMQKQMIDFYSQSQPSYKIPTLDDIKVVKGVSSIYIYSGETKSYFGTKKNLGTFVMKDSKESSLPPMKLVYIKKKWYIWD